MTRMERKRRRQWIAVYLILAAVILALAGAIVWAQPWEQEPVERVPHEPPYPVFEETTVQIATDHPTRETYPRYDVPIDRYTQEILWNACQEWDVPYELALAVCWRETEFIDKVTPLDSGTYYGMMAVDIEDAGYHMELCGVDNLDTEENRLRVGCCILGSHLDTYDGNLHRALMAYNGGPDYATSKWALGVYYTNYTLDVLNKMEDLMG